ncbi:hypothetical protein H6784_00565 [Candidatus Nomurabacteria bacterium]|nr:hypothetical protein [Candidatus Kaiserbacteria bacterium]MCB9813886.1 hypothetical protein [Candidatus Nomurabacteria bacterium]
MIKRDQIESILKINGVAPSSPDEQIRSVLLSARYSKDEVDTAIMVLRENTKTNQTRVDGLHKVFRSSEALNSEEISQLLGIDVDIDNITSTKVKGRGVYGWQYVVVWVMSVVISVVGILMYMYLYRVGVFHPSVGLIHP